MYKRLYVAHFMIRKIFASALEIIEIAAITIGAVFVIRTYLVQPFVVGGESMKPTFSDGDYLIVDELSYRFRQPQYTDVIVFKYPNDPETYFVKRIIAVPGERVKIEDGRVTIYSQQHPDGKVLEEAYLPQGTTTNRDGQYTVGPGEYFVMGDNRSYSYDSRSWGMLPQNMIVGLVRIRLWPITKAAVFTRHEYAQ